MSIEMNPPIKRNRRISGLEQFTEGQFIERSLSPTLTEVLSEYPAVMLVGPRQSGKTTLLLHELRGTFDYVSLDDLKMRRLANYDPRRLLAEHPDPVIVDEVQHAPDLLSYIKLKIDAERHKRGRFILTGSQNLLLAGSVSESLAGRVAILELLPLSRREIEGTPEAELPWEQNSPLKQKARLSFRQLWDAFLTGGYPELVSVPGLDVTRWHSNYVRTYLERDVRSIGHVGDLMQFQGFIEAVAARSGQLFNVGEVSRDLGISAKTIKAWLSILEATYQVFIVRPHFENVGKRLVKMPKVYFADTGTLCFSTGLKDPDHAADGPMGGAILETAVLSELMKVLSRGGIRPRVYFWRTQSGEEVDFLVQINGQFVPIEVKKSGTPTPRMGTQIRVFQRALGQKARHGYVIHPGDLRISLGDGVTALPFADL